MYGLASIRAINAAASTRGKDTATQVRLARNEKIKEDLHRQKTGRVGSRKDT